MGVAWGRCWRRRDSDLPFVGPDILFPFPDEADQRQYEEWLFHTQQLLQMQLKVLEEQIGVHRKSRKALCAKQRTAKKAGREFPEADAEKLKLVTEQQSKIQKQLDQVGKADFSLVTRSPEEGGHGWAGSRLSPDSPMLGPEAAEGAHQPHGRIPE